MSRRLATRALMSSLVSRVVGFSPRRVWRRRRSWVVSAIPASDGGAGVGFCADDGAVAVKFAVEVGDALAELVAAGCFVGVGSGGVGEGLVEVVGVEEFREPPIESGEEGFFFHVDGSQVVVCGVGAAELAAVVGAVVVPGAFHPSSALGAADPAGQQVASARFGGAGRRSAVAGESFLDGVPLWAADQWWVGWLVRPDPLGRVVPPHPGLVAQADVSHVDEYFVAALTVPDLVAGVAGVVEDGSHRGGLPFRTGGLAVGGCGRDRLRRGRESPRR